MLVREGDLKTIGSKARGLNRCVLLGARVPDFVVVPTRFHAMEDRNTALVQLCGELADALDRLGGSVSVRSSSVNEDGPDRSSAGRYRTVLGVKDLPALEKALAAVWDSSDGPPMAVIIQRMVEPDIAGVLFTRNPVTGSNSTVIEFVRGRGDRLVSGKADPERLELQNGADPAPIHPFRELLFVSRRLEDGFGYPLDIEWAESGGVFHILQARPVTGLAPPERTTAPSYSRVHAEEFFSGPVTPLFHSIFKRLYADYYIGETLRTLGVRAPADIPQLVRHKNYLYASTWHAEYAIARTPRGPVRKRFLETLPPDLRNITSGKGRFGGSLDVLRLLGFLAARPGLWIWNLDRDFRERTVPEIIQRLDDTGDLGQMGCRELWAAYEKLVQTAALHIRTSKWGIVLYSIPMMDLMSRLLEKGGIGPGELPLLISGLDDNQTFAASLELRGLAEDILKDENAIEAVRADLRSYPEYRKALLKVPEGELLVAAFESILARHGHRRLSRDLISPSWKDEPMIPFGIVLALVAEHVMECSIDGPASSLSLREERGALTNDAPSHSPAAHPLSARRRELETRDAARDHVERTLPLGRKWLFRLLMRYLARYASFRELQRFYLDMILAKLRELALEISARMRQAGILGRSDDIFFLEMVDIDRFLLGEPTPGLREKALVARMAYEDRSGTPGRYMRAGVDFDEMEGLPDVMPSGRCIKGQSVSPGSHRGKARVILELDRESSIDRGDVIVTRCLDPGQTHFLMMAGALILEVGGMLSHGAILARELGVPTVARVRNATGLFKDGQIVSVNGSNGTISMES
jgi:pyruvate,water dikinase